MPEAASAALSPGQAPVDRRRCPLSFAAGGTRTRQRQRGAVKGREPSEKPLLVYNSFILLRRMPACASSAPHNLGERQTLLP